MLSGLSGHNIIFYPFVRVFNVNWAHKLRAGLEFVSHSVWKEQNRYDIWPAYMWSKDWRHMHKRVHTSTTHLEIKAMRWYSNLPTTELFTKERAVDSWIVGFNIIWQMIRLLLIRLLHFLFCFCFVNFFRLQIFFLDLWSINIVIIERKLLQNHPTTFNYLQKQHLSNSNNSLWSCVKWFRSLSGYSFILPSNFLLCDFFSHLCIFMKLVAQSLARNIGEKK